MKVVKLTTGWNNVSLSLTPNSSGVFGNYLFEIDNDCTECDYWVIWGGLSKTETVKCPEQNVVYITDEAHSMRVFNKQFLKQFPVVFAVRTDLTHSNVKQIHELGIWHFPMSYDELVKLEPVQQKDRQLSIVSSDLTMLEGHKKRFAFTNILKGHFKRRIDIYGRGINPISNKFKALAPYKYSVAIENSVIPNYFTEKLFECYLSYTMPIYSGCPNVTDYFNKESLVQIEINKYEESIQQIEELIHSNTFENKIDVLVEARKKYLQEYFFFPGLIKFLELYDSTFITGNRKKVQIRPELYPLFHLENNLKKVYKSVAGKFGI